MLSYLALGDSYTIGEQVPFAENFPSQTVQLLRQVPVDIADPVVIATTGWTTDELQVAISEQHIQETFTLVTLLIGVNNQYRGRSLNNYQEEFSQLLLQAQDFAGGQSNRVFVLSIPDWGVTPFAEGRDRIQIAREIDQYNQTAKEICQAQHCRFIDITDSTRSNGTNLDFLAEDALHPSGKEYRVWAERLSKEIVQHHPLFQGRF